MKDPTLLYYTLYVYIVHCTRTSVIYSVYVYMCTGYQVPTLVMKYCHKNFGPGAPKLSAKIGPPCQKWSVCVCCVHEYCRSLAIDDISKVY